jgi:hypothetical protein
VAESDPVRSTALTFAGTLLCFFVMSASAQTTAVAGGNPNHIDLSIPVTASVAVRCGIAIGGTYTAPDINAGFTHDFDFVLQCNVPTRVAVESVNGGLLAPVSTPPPGYARLAPYHVTLHLVGNAGVTSVTADCEAQVLLASTALPCTFKGPASTTQGLKLNGASSNAVGSYLRVSAPIYAGANRLIASSGYADTLTVTLSAAF